MYSGHAKTKEPLYLILICPFPLPTMDDDGARTRPRVNVVTWPKGAPYWRRGHTQAGVIGDPFYCTCAVLSWNNYTGTVPFIGHSTASFLFPESRCSVVYPIPAVYSSSFGNVQQYSNETGDQGAQCRRGTRLAVTIFSCLKASIAN